MNPQPPKAPQKAWKRISIFLVLIVLAISCFYSGVDVRMSYDKKHPVIDTSPDVYDLWADTNAQRQAAGETDLVLDAGLVASSTAKCVDMIQQNYWGHISPTGQTPQDLIQKVVPDPITDYYSGENLSIDYNTSDAVTNAWMASPGHKANILNAHYTNVGYAVCTNKSAQIMVVQEFLGS